MLAQSFYRDFALCYLYHFLVDSSLPSVVPVGLFDDVESALNDRDDVSFEFALSKTIDVDSWSHTL